MPVGDKLKSFEAAVKAEDFRERALVKAAKDETAAKVEAARLASERAINVEYTSLMSSLHQAKAQYLAATCAEYTAREAYKVVAKALAGAPVGPLGLFSQEVVETKLQLRAATLLVEKKYEDLLVAKAIVDRINSKVEKFTKKHKNLQLIDDPLDPGVQAKQDSGAD